MKHALVFWICLTAIFALTPKSDAQHAPPATAGLAGDWSGSLAVGGTSLRLVIHFSKGANGNWNAAFDSPDQGAAGLPFSLTRLTGGSVHLEAAAIGASFDGMLDLAGKTLSGHWMQGGSSLPLTLSKTDHAPVVSRPQEPKPPFPYTARDVSFPGGAFGVTLAGTLTVPPGKGPFAGIVLIAGSGRTDRDEQVFGHKPFLVLADTLTRHGIAVLRYDKRGTGQSTGSYALATSADFASDAYAAVAFLKAQPALDSKRIGLLGHSEGGLIAPMVASKYPAEIAFVVLFAAPGMSIEKILLAQDALIAKAYGASPAQISKNDALQRQLFAIVEHAPNPAIVQAKAQAAIVRAVSTMSPADKARIGDPRLYAKALSRPLTMPWFRYFLTYNPVPALQRTRCPVLALDGSKDLQVPPQEDLAGIASALQAGGNTHITVKELPNLNHLFQTCKTGSPSEYARIEETISPNALAALTDWLDTRLAAEAVQP